MSSQEYAKYSELDFDKIKITPRSSIDVIKKNESEIALIENKQLNENSKLKQSPFGKILKRLRKNKKTKTYESSYTSFEHNMKDVFLAATNSTRRRKTTSAVERDNNMKGWNINTVAINNIETVDHYRDTQTIYLYGSEIVLELPKKFTENDRLILSKIRNERRNAVHIYDAEVLKDLLWNSLSMKQASFFK